MVEGPVYKRITVPSRDTGRSNKVDLYLPSNYDNSQAAPVMINMHGYVCDSLSDFLPTHHLFRRSGFVVPMLGTDRRYCSIIAARTGSIVFDIDYRKAPEHPFPAALQDLEDVIAYIGTHPSLYDISNLFLSGFSAGGMIVLATAGILGPERIKGVVGIYARADATKDYPTPAQEKQPAEGVSQNDGLRRVMRESYYLPGVDLADPRISAQFSPAEQFPAHVYLACGNADDLHGNGEAFVRKLKDAGHEDATFQSIKHERHAFDKGKLNTPAAAKAEIMYEAVAEMVNRAVRK